MLLNPRTTILDLVLSGLLRELGNFVSSAAISCSTERRAHVWTRTIRTVGRNVVAATVRPSPNG